MIVIQWAIVISMLLGLCWIIGACHEADSSERPSVSKTIVIGAGVVAMASAIASVVVAVIFVAVWALVGVVG